MPQYVPCSFLVTGRRVATSVLELDTVTVLHVATANASGSSVVSGGQISVSAGEYVVTPPETGGIARNEGDEPAVVSVAGIMPAAGASGGATPAG